MLTSALCNDPATRLPDGRWLVALLTIIVPLAAAQSISDRINAALDREIDDEIEIEDQPIRDALYELEKATGLRFAIHEQALEWMPYGERTRISMELDDISVRAGLTRIFTGLGLTMRVEGDRVLIEPAPVLDRLGRRLTLDEVRLLQRLAAKPWRKIDSDDLRLAFRMETDGDWRKRLEWAISEVPPGNAAEQLEAAVAQWDAVWVPQGDSILIYSRKGEIGKLLDRPMDLNLKRIALDKLLLTLSQRTGVPLRFQPGALESVGAGERRVDIVQRDITFRQVLELIAGSTGLRYAVTGDGVEISSARAMVTQRDSGPRVVAILRVPMADGTTFDILLREDQLSEEHRDLIDRLLERKLPEVIEVLRERVGR
jgi:hypothetical protein